MSGCTDFKENAWRKDLCVNCLKHRQDHSGLNTQAKPATPTKPKLARQPVVLNKEKNLQNVADRLPKFIKPKSDLEIVDKKEGTKQRKSDIFPSRKIENKENVELSRSKSYDNSQTLAKQDGSQSPAKRKATDKKDPSPKQKKERVRSVEFADDEPEIIGYDGGLHSHAGGDDDDGVFESKVTSGRVSPMSEEEKQFAAKTFVNTRLNSSLETLNSVDSDQVGSRSLEYEDVALFQEKPPPKTGDNSSSQIYGTFPLRVKPQKAVKPSAVAIFRSNPVDDLRRRSGAYRAEPNRDSVSSQSQSQTSEDSSAGVAHQPKSVTTSTSHYNTPLSIKTSLPANTSATNDHYKAPTNDAELITEPDYFVLDTRSDQPSPLSPSEQAHQDMPVEAYHVRKGPKQQFARPYRVVDVTPTSVVCPYTIVDVSSSLPIDEPDSQAPALPKTPAPDRAESPPQKAAKTSPTHRTASPKTKAPAPRAGVGASKEIDSSKEGIYEPIGVASVEPVTNESDPAFVRNENVRLSIGKNPAFAAKAATIAKTMDFNKGKQKRHAPSPPATEGPSSEEPKVKPPRRKQAYATRLNSQENYLSGKELTVNVTERPTSPPLPETSPADVGESYSNIKDRKDKKGKSFFKKLLKFRNKESAEYELCSNPGALSPEAKLYVESWLADSLEHLDNPDVFSDPEGDESSKRDTRKDISAPVLVYKTSRIEAMLVRSSSSDGQLGTAPSGGNKGGVQSEDAVGKLPKKSPSKRPPPPPPPSNKPSITSSHGSSSDLVDKEAGESAKKTSPRQKQYDTTPKEISDTKSSSTPQKQRKVPIVIKKLRPPPPPASNKPRSSTLPPEIPAAGDNQFKASAADVVAVKRQLTKQVSFPETNFTTDTSIYSGIDSGDELDCPTGPPPDPPVVTTETNKPENMYDTVGAPSSEANTCSTCNSQGSALEGYLEPVATVTKDTMKEIEKQLKRHSKEVIEAELENVMREGHVDVTKGTSTETTDGAPVPMPRRRTRSRNSDSPAAVLSVSDPYVMVWKQDTPSTSNAPHTANNNFAFRPTETNTTVQTLNTMDGLNLSYIKVLMRQVSVDSGLQWCCQGGESFQWNSFKLSEKTPQYKNQNIMCYRAKHLGSENDSVLLVNQNGDSFTTTTVGGEVIALPKFTTQLSSAALSGVNGEVNVTVIPTKNVAGLESALRDSFHGNSEDGQEKAASYLLQLCKLFSAYSGCETTISENVKSVSDHMFDLKLQDFFAWESVGAQNSYVSAFKGLCEKTSCVKSFCALMCDVTKAVRDQVTNLEQFKVVLTFLSEMSNATLGDHQVVLECFLWGPDLSEREKILESVDQVDTVKMWLSVERTKAIGQFVTQTSTPTVHHLEFLHDADPVKLCEVIKLFHTSTV